jgi:hypothetical protein
MKRFIPSRFEYLLQSLERVYELEDVGKEIENRVQVWFQKTNFVKVDSTNEDLEL